jgi:hypothetical protein
MDPSTCQPLDPYTFHPLVCAYLVRVVGEATRTSRVWDFGTPENLECSIVERPKGPKVSDTWKVYETSGLREVLCIDNKEAFITKVSNSLLSFMLDTCVLDEYCVFHWLR